MLIIIEAGFGADNQARGLVSFISFAIVPSAICFPLCLKSASCRTFFTNSTQSPVPPFLGLPVDRARALPRIHDTRGRGIP